ncbi:class I SAM-dependent methyltransferase [Methanolobus psychrotolerans]|uniref:class I SAM-dependent methyltransferase n=1 Tax=Methanolobus psychrotolerans TaxID=1874706 RepID=UPI000B916448|nr:class I SAM-dependent methyltransferase [Methanolobus psychrotolerans]
MVSHNLKDVSETLLIPLWARAEEWDKADPVIMDEHALNLVKKIDYDFSKFKGAWMSQLGCAVRANILDRETKRFVRAHPDATIINLGCGLDTRFFRVDNGSINWYDLDLPPVIEVRKQFFEETVRYRMLGRSIFDYYWMDDIEHADQPVLFISEGVFMYFEPDQVQDILTRLIESFPNARMLLEVFPKFALRFSRKHETLKMMDEHLVFKWGVKKPADLETVDSRLRVRESFNLFDIRKDRWRWLGKLAYIPWFRNNMSNRILRIEFV